jgi:hypothetical protein
MRFENIHKLYLSESLVYQDPTAIELRSGMPARAARPPGPPVTALAEAALALGLALAAWRRTVCGIEFRAENRFDIYIRTLNGHPERRRDEAISGGEGS